MRIVKEKGLEKIMPFLKQGNDDLEVTALRVLVNLSLSDECHDEFCDVGAIDALLTASSKDGTEMQTLALASLQMLTYTEVVRDYVEKKELVPDIVALVKKTKNPQAKSGFCRLLAKLAFNGKIRKYFAQSGELKALEKLKDDNENNAELHKDVLLAFKNLSVAYYVDTDINQELDPEIERVKDYIRMNNLLSEQSVLSEIDSARKKDTEDKIEDDEQEPEPKKPEKPSEDENKGKEPEKPTKTTPTASETKESSDKGEKDEEEPKPKKPRKSRDKKPPRDKKRKTKTGERKKKSETKTEDAVSSSKPKKTRSKGSKSKTSSTKEEQEDGAGDVKKSVKKSRKGTKAKKSGSTKKRKPKKEKTEKPKTEKEDLGAGEKPKEPEEPEFDAKQVERVKKEMKRKLIADEILTTEESYVKGIGRLVKKFKNPLQAACSQHNPFITQADVRRIFSDIETIYSVNMMLLSQLKDKLRAWSPKQTLSDVFLYMAEFLKTYSTYINNYEQSQYALASCKKNKRFMSFLEDAQADPTLNHMDIYSFLILPIQRVPRYEMLLGALLKATMDDHPDYTPLAKAKDKILGVNVFLNDQKRGAEERKEMFSHLQHYVGDLEVLMAPHRKLHVVENVTINAQRKKAEGRVWVFNDIAMFTKTKQGRKKVVHDKFWMSNKHQDIKHLAKTKDNEILITYDKESKLVFKEPEVREKIYKQLFSVLPKPS